MTDRTDSGESSPQERRQAKVWQRLVALQIAVLAVILLALLVIFLVGILGSHFAQRTL